MNTAWKDITIHDIAKKLNLATSTVSRALNEHPKIRIETRRLVKETAAQMNFDFRTSRHHRSHHPTVGVILPFLEKDHMSPIVSGISEAARLANFSVIISQSAGSPSQEEKLARKLIETGVNGLLLCPANSALSGGLYEYAKKQGVPICTFQNSVGLEHETKVTINNYQAAYELTSHLIKEGCREIIHLTPPGYQQVSIYAERYQGYRQALADHNLTFEENMLITTEMTIQGGEKAANRIANLPIVPDAVFAADDKCAVGCMKSLKLFGLLVPRDVAIAGFNDDGIATIAQPELTTVQINGYEMGQAAFRCIYNNAGLTQQEQITELPYKIIMRGSTALDFERDNF